MILRNQEREFLFPTNFLVGMKHQKYARSEKMGAALEWCSLIWALGWGSLLWAHSARVKQAALGGSLLRLEV